MTLAAIQAAFQAGILNGERAVLDLLRDSQKTDRATLFAVYADGYRARLAEYICNDFPVLREHLGEDAFGCLVEEYVVATQSHHPNARWYGRRLPDFMSESAAWRENREAIDLARFERALSDAFDAPDAAVASISSLQAIPQEAWPRLTFDLHPSVSVLDLAEGTLRLYEALSNDDEPLAPSQGQETVVIWRKDNEIFFRSCLEDERLALFEIRERTEFGDICSLLEFREKRADLTGQLAEYVSQWFTDGLLARVSIGGATSRPPTCRS
ncbi:MAG TPA: putative DNA-binding domain-containing protein [Methylocella sp.]|nr:putative DNA-binding domain-containing protein [Methylocella sp.]